MKQNVMIDYVEGAREVDGSDDSSFRWFALVEARGDRIGERK